MSSSRSAGGASLACSALTGWPTASKVHFVTYQIDSNSDPVAGTQLDCYGIVSGSTINSFNVVDGTDTGNSIGDVVEMLPTAAWGQDLADALTAEHTRTGLHAAITATSVTSTGNVQSATALVSDTVSEKTAATGVTVDGVKLKDGAVQTAAALSPVYTANPYKFSAYRNAAWTAAGSYSKVPFDTEFFDTGSNFDSVTNYRFTAPVNGFYQFNAGVKSNAAAGALAGIAFYKNGVLANSIEIENGVNTTPIGPGISHLYQLVATDYIEVYHYGSASTGSTGAATFFSGYLVSAT